MPLIRLSSLIVIHHFAEGIHHTFATGRVIAQCRYAAASTSPKPGLGNSIDNEAQKAHYYSFHGFEAAIEVGRRKGAAGRRCPSGQVQPCSEPLPRKDPRVPLIRHSQRQNNGYSTLAPDSGRTRLGRKLFSTAATFRVLLPRKNPPRLVSGSYSFVRK
ncbi:hypothetical protein BR93DRAFT_585305 [Coniochaeta sp. PMI_546]|nr:hypothetical protein BR93DRAFT_585305 [Coniochaeta sp. PMI_546]